MELIDCLTVIFLWDALKDRWIDRYSRIECTIVINWSTVLLWIGLNVFLLILDYEYIGSIYLVSNIDSDHYWCDGN